MKVLATCALTLLLLGCKSVPSTSSFNTALHDELMKMHSEDLSSRIPGPTNPAEVKLVVASDARHTARMKEIVLAYGWPGKTLVGDDGAGAAFLLVQHADADPQFQRRALTMMKPLVRSGEVRASDYAYLWDRTHVPQRYGTQGQCVGKELWKPDKVEDAAHLDALRVEVGLPPMSVYIPIVAKLCTS